MRQEKNLDKIAVKKINNFPGRPTVVFLHDSLGCIELWRDFPEKLGHLTQCNVLIYDRQGYGQSIPFSVSERNNDYMEHEADMLNDLLDFWKTEKVILFGHSDGGSIALIAAAKYPEKILGVITEGAHIFVEDITLNGIAAAEELYCSTDLKKRLEKYHGDKTEKMFFAWASTWKKQAFRDWNIEHFLKDITCPSLIIQGEEDEYGSIEQVDKIVSQTNGDALKLMISNVKHSPHKEMPELILKSSSDFIKEILQ